MSGLARVVKTNSHTDYVAQVYRRWEVPAPPQPADYAFGTFVRIPVEVPGDGQTELVGIVYDSILVNPEFGSLGPRLASREAVEVFAPDYLDEKALLLGIFLVGERHGPPTIEGAVTHDVPGLVAEVDAEVFGMDDAQVRAFHSRDGSPRVGYFPRLMQQPSAVAPSLMLRILDRLTQYFPADAARLAVLRRNVAWRATVGASR